MSREFLKELPDIKFYEELDNIPEWVEIAIDGFIKILNDPDKKIMIDCALKVGYAMGRNELR